LASVALLQSVLLFHLSLGLERYWYWVSGYLAIFADIGWYCYWGIFFFIVTPNMNYMIPIRQQSAPSTW